MPSITFTDIAGFRLQATSFFVVGFLACAWIIQWIWNRVMREIVQLPRLTYSRAAGLTLIWGLMFLLVLTMISGARELMTPGAWQKKGLTYKLASEAPKKESSDDGVYATRLEKMAKLRDALWQYAKRHDSVLPADIDASGLAEEMWRVPDPSGMNYLYFGGVVEKGGSQVVLLEPRIFHDRQLALTAGGTIGRLGDIDLEYGPRKGDR